MADTAQQIAYLQARRRQLEVDHSAYNIKISQVESYIRNIDARIAELEAEAANV